jgi:C-terminal processing protease CtpA/Prc
MALRRALLLLMLGLAFGVAHGTTCSIPIAAYTSDAPDGQPIVDHITVIDAAGKCQLRDGDQIIAIDGTGLAGMNFKDADAALHGYEGTTVKLTVVRSGVTLSFDVVREIAVYTKEQAALQEAILLKEKDRHPR